jgi:polyhydroxyalkanoate synthesis regulator phasin
MAKKKGKKRPQEAKTVEKALRVGLGLISLGGEKVSDMMDELAKRGKKYAGKKDSAVQKLASSISETGDVIKTKGGEASEWVTKKGGVASEWVSKEVRQVAKKFDFATRDEFNQLRAEVEALKKLVGKKPAKKKKTTRRKKTAKAAKT